MPGTSLMLAAARQCGEGSILRRAGQCARILSIDILSQIIYVISQMDDIIFDIIIWRRECKTIALISSGFCLKNSK